MKIRRFTFNPFAENTYIVYDDTGECAIVDPGCFEVNEKKQLAAFISTHNLKPVKLINTHCHIDHVLGIPFVCEKYGLELEMHKGEIPVLLSTERVSAMYGIPTEPMPEPARFLDENDVVEFGNSRLSILFTPGHSPASICFYDKAGKQLIAGDVLFRGSIGRTDLPGGSYETLMGSIMDKLMTLPDDVTVYPGHMDETTIGTERRTNPFIEEWLARNK